MALKTPNIMIIVLDKSNFIKLDSRINIKIKYPIIFKYFPILLSPPYILYYTYFIFFSQFKQKSNKKNQLFN